MHSAIDANVEHRKRLAERSDDQRPLAAQLLGEGHESDGSYDDLDNAVYTGCEKTARRAHQSNLPEDLRRVVVYRIRSRPLLPKHQNDAKAGAVKHLLAGSCGPNLRHQRHLLVAVEVLDDFIELLHNVWVVGGLAADLREGFGGVGDAILFDEPPRGLIHKDDAREEASAREDLQGEGDAPFCFRGGVGDVEVDAVVYEEGEANAGDIEELLHDLSVRCRRLTVLWTYHAPNTSSSNFLRRIFSNVRRDNRADQSDAKTSNNASDVKLREVPAEDQRLYQRANDENDIRNDERPLATESVANVE